MLEKQIREDIIALIGREVIPAVGCTEPAAVALCCAHAARLIGGADDIDRVEVNLSGNMLKNAMGVGIPGTGMVGLPIAIALGTLYGDPGKQLEVLSDITDERLAAAKAFIQRKAIDINLKADAPDVLYIEVKVWSKDGHVAEATIACSHTHLMHLALDGKEQLAGEEPKAEGEPKVEQTAEATAPKLTLKAVWEFATESPLDELRFILEARRLNKNIAEKSFCGHYGHCVGVTLKGQREKAMLGDTIFSHILSYTSAACDARMAGAPLAVMSNSGSGNQGIASTLPVVVYAEETGADEEHTIRALALSHLTVIYIKQSLGRLSALCGCVVAATGSACGLCYLMGGDYNRVAATAKNMVANLTGMICDGAKPGCALKVTSGVSTAVLSALLAMEGHCVESVEGIVDDDVDRTIGNLARIGRTGMRETDRLILEIMTSK